MTSGLPRFAMKRILAVMECSSLARSAGRGAESSLCWNSFSWEGVYGFFTAAPTAASRSRTPGLFVIS